MTKGRHDNQLGTRVGSGSCGPQNTVYTRAQTEMTRRILVSDKLGREYLVMAGLFSCYDFVLDTGRMKDGE